MGAGTAESQGEGEFHVLTRELGRKVAPTVDPKTGARNVVWSFTRSNPVTGRHTELHYNLTLARDAFIDIDLMTDVEHVHCNGTDALIIKVSDRTSRLHGMTDPWYYPVGYGNGFEWEDMGTSRPEERYEIINARLAEALQRQVEFSELVRASPPSGLDLTLSPCARGFPLFHRHLPAICASFDEVNYNSMPMDSCSKTT